VKGFSIIFVYVNERLFNNSGEGDLLDSRELILRIKRGDDDVFADIIDTYASYLAKVINSVYELNTQDTEDIIAETMFSVWKNGKKLKEDMNFKSYMAKIARNKTIDHIRKRRHDLIELDINLSDGSDIESDLLRKELVTLLNEKIEETQEPDKSILEMKYYHGLKSKEIADKLNLNQNTVDIRLFRQREKLKNMFLKMEVL
jgi:RNA polymerase sigma-70 factor (ECF subfamily)